jgi:hypothetical protein
MTLTGVKISRSSLVPDLMDSLVNTRIIYECGYILVLNPEPGRRMVSRVRFTTTAE